MKGKLSAILVISIAAFAQLPTGSVIGTVSDSTGASIPGASVAVIHKASGARRSLTTGVDGGFAVASLAGGQYEVRVEAQGFRTTIRDALVETGSSTTVAFQLEVGATTEVIQVEGVSAQVATDSFKVDGVITRQQIQDLPLNGRSFMQLAFLEPGVTVSPGSTSQYNSQFNVSILGGSASLAAITVDGGNVRDPVDGNSGTNFSQEIVQEFQLSAVNFDLSTGITATGAVNIVSRSGSNEFHGSGYFFFRDNNMAAFPGLARNPVDPDPFFARRQSGAWLGGPIVRNKLFFFYNVEHLNQDAVVIVQPNSPFFSSLVGSYSNPYTGTQHSPKVDWQINDNHRLFLRYSNDRNNAFGPRGGATLPSNWLVNRNRADQVVLGWTTTLRPTLVNDLRGSFWYWSNRNLFPTENECPGCLGLGLPETTVIGTNVVFGNTQNATQGRNLRRGNLINTMTWQKGTHRFRFGGEIDLSDGTGFWGYADPAAGAVYGPDILGPARALFGIPDQITTVADLAKLPMFTYTMGIGNPAQPPPFNIQKARRNDRYRVFFQDAWRVSSTFTLNYGVAWQYESALVNHDLDKPELLRPIMDDIRPSDRDFNNITPSLGFAWNVGGDNKTVIRGGAGIYYDTRLLWQRLEERTIIGPLGNGRLPLPSSAVPSPISVPALGGGAIPGVSAGTPLDFRNGPTSFTLGNFLSILGPVRAGLEQQFSGSGDDLSVRVINISKSGSNLIPAYYPAAYSTHVNFGIQREIFRDTVVTADIVSRQFVRQEIGSLDWNRFLRPQGPIIPRCTSAAQAQNPLSNCSAGQITVRTPAGRTNYKALLVRVDKRFTKNWQMLASYALTNQRGINGIADLDNWFDTWGPQGSQHLFNLSGIIDLPWKFQFSFISTMASRGPVHPRITAVDLIGSGVDNSPVPFLLYNSLNRGLGKPELEQAVDLYNATYAGTRTPRGQLAPRVTLPANYQLGDNFISQDIRVSKFFDFGERIRLTILGEAFNIFNIANLTGFAFDLNNQASFGQPTQRANQVFGTGGPRSFQLAARFSF
jgi:hypothetical protein